MCWFVKIRASYRSSAPQGGRDVSGNVNRPLGPSSTEHKVSTEQCSRQQRGPHQQRRPYPAPNQPHISFSKGLPPICPPLSKQRNNCGTEFSQTGHLSKIQMTRGHLNYGTLFHMVTLCICACFLYDFCVRV